MTVAQTTIAETRIPVGGALELGDTKLMCDVVSLPAHLRKMKGQ